MRLARSISWVLSVAVFFSLGSCAEAACELGCDEEHEDCLDNPDAYVLGSCGRASGSELDACVEQFCDRILEQCRRDCRTTDLSR